MAEAPVVFIPQARAVEFEPFVHIPQAAGATVEAVDLNDPTAKAAALARAMVGVIMGPIAMGEAEFAAAPQLRAVLTPTIGIDRIDTDAATG